MRCGAEPQLAGMTGTKLELFKTAMDLFAERGYANVSMRDISNKLGLNVASIYNHFPSKESFLDVAFGVYRHRIQERLPDLDELMALIPVMEPREILEKTLTAYESEGFEVMVKIAIVALEEQHRHREAGRLVTETFIDSSEEYIGRLLEEMVAQEVIEPLDIKNFVRLHSAFNLYASLQLDSCRALSLGGWRDGHRFLFGMVQPKR